MTIIGRTPAKAKKLDSALSIVLGKTYRWDQRKPTLDREVRLDINEPHMVLICGKRGFGKSYTMGVILEGLLDQRPEIRDALSLVVIDAMGVFWTIQQPSGSPMEVFDGWGVKSRGFAVTVYYPEGLREKYTPYAQFFHKGFQLYPSELELADWLYMLDIGETQAQATILARIIKLVKTSRGRFYSVEDMLHALDRVDAPDNVKSALGRRLEKVLEWGIFSDQGQRIEDVFAPGSCLIFDLSGAGELPWNVRTLLTALLCKKMYSKRAFMRTNEEIARIYGSSIDVTFPLIWLFIDEAHIFAPNERATPATDPLLEWVRQGRRPGLSIVLASQQPGALDSRILSQCDTLVIHRLTAGQDSAAIGSRISEIYDAKSITHYMKILPKEPGYAIVLNDLTEEIVPIKIRPRQSWDGGGSAKLEDYVSVRSLTDQERI
jgi:energy-coupling factor transporter ATP-binding protein EcfA2